MMQTRSDGTRGMTGAVPAGPDRAPSPPDRAPSPDVFAPDVFAPDVFAPDVFAMARVWVDAALEAMVAAGILQDGLETARVAVEPPRDPAHGDVTTNAAMILARPAGLRPRDLATTLAGHLERQGAVTRATVAGPGFVNLTLADAFWHDRLREAWEAGESHGNSGIGAGRPVNVEYVSTNPTGPLHVGHARGAVVGDALAALLTRAGFAVTREYYVNDAGAQVDTLARSVYLRYREALGETVGDVPAGLYPGDYLRPVGAALAARDGRQWQDRPEEEWLPPVRDFAVARMLDLIRDDLAALGVRPDVFTSERAVVEAGGMEEVLARFEAAGLLYTGILEPPRGKAPPAGWENRPQLLFRASTFGDDLDRPIRKSDGSWTYFATDLAYHLDKIRRGFTHMINVLGADHDGYVKRIRAGVAGLCPTARLEVETCRMVRLLEDGKPAKMSKRAGTFVTLRDLLDRVGPDVVRFVMLTRRPGARLDFDIHKATEQTRDNPVFYVQYAHARCCSVLRHARTWPELAAAWPAPGQRPPAGPDLGRLVDPLELQLVKIIAAWPWTVAQAAHVHEPHRIAYYLADLAGAFHTLWTRGTETAALRFLRPGDPLLSQARLVLIETTANVIRSGLGIMGVTPAEELHA